jgi:hypothetical protein
MKQTVLILIFSIMIAGCDSNPTYTHNDSKLILEQYFYSENEANLKKLAETLETEGYSINDYRSYELRGRTEWYFYSSKEITEGEIYVEDAKSEKYAEEYNVGYDGHGFPLE